GEGAARYGVGVGLQQAGMADGRGRSQHGSRHQAVEVVFEVGVAIGRDGGAVGGVVGVQAHAGFPGIGHAVVVGIGGRGPAIENGPGHLRG
nr:hypothetical protein [Tanacetum cinerariifolium]